MVKTIAQEVYFFVRSAWLWLLFPAKPARSIDPQHVRSLLVIRIDRIGDLVVSVPAIKKLKELFPGATLTCLSSPAAAALAVMVPEIDTVEVYKGFIPAVVSLRKKRFDLIVDLLMDYPLKTALLSYLAGPVFSAGFDIRGRGRLFALAVRPSVKPLPMSAHILAIPAAVAAAAGKPFEQPFAAAPELKLTPGQADFARSYYTGCGIQDRDILIGIAPGGFYPSQRWPAEKFARLADQAIRRFGAKVLLAAGPHEQGLLRDIVAHMQEKPFVAAGLPLDQLAALISRMNVLVCNNSGPLHIAAGLGVPTVSTMGPTDPLLWQPQGEGQIVIRKQVPCSPCSRGSCRTHRCMEEITVEEMEEGVAGSLGKKR